MPKTFFRDRKCLVTGAASGIGEAIARQAAAEGAQLFLTDINTSALDKVVADIRKAGGSVAAFRAFDISDYEAVKGFAENIHDQHGSLDVIMNVAGIAIWGSVETLTHGDWRKTVDVNLMGPIHVIENFVPAMIQAGKGGHLVNVSSAAGLFGLPWHAAYSASKFGLRGVSEVLRFDLRRHGIKVSLVCPGGVDTGLVNTLNISGVDSQGPVFTKLRAHFRKRAVSPEQAASAIIRGVKAGKYMIFTSFDIRLGYWFQRKCAWPYEWVMRLLNRGMHAAVARSLHYGKEAG